MPELHTPALNELLRIGEFRFESLTTTELYARYLCGRFRLPENSVYASPVWQQAGMHSITLLDAPHTCLSAQNAQAFCDGLNSFYRDEAHFSPIRPDLWRLTLPTPPQWQAPPLFEVLGQIDGNTRAEGEGQTQWLQLQTEIQMWLHDHPVNRHLANQNRPHINSIWLWNAPDTGQAIHPSALIGSNSPWADECPLPVQAAPQDFAQWQAVCADKQLNIAETSLFLDDLMPSAATGDLYAYHEVLQSWDSRFFEPIVAALKKGSLNAARIITDGINGGVFTVEPPSFWSFFKSKRHFNGKNL